MDKRIFTHLFNTTNKFVRETLGETPKEPEKVAAVKAFFTKHDFGCQTNNAARLVELYLGVPLNSFHTKQNSNRYVHMVAPAGTVLRTNHARPRFIVSLGGGSFFDPGVSAQRQNYREDQVKVEHINKEDLTAFLNKHGDLLLTFLPIVLV